MSKATELLEQQGFVGALLGDIPGLYSIHLAGRGILVGGTWMDISSSGRAYVWLDAPQGLEVRSGNNNDYALVGSGAWGVRITGLDSSLKLVSEDIGLNGTTAKPTLRTNWLRVLDVEVLGPNANLGIVVVRRLAPFTTDSLAVVPAGDCRRIGSTWTVPANARLHVFGWRFTSGIPSYNARLRRRDLGGAWMIRFPCPGNYAPNDGVRHSLPITFNAGCDLAWEAYEAGLYSFELSALMEVL